MAIDSFYPERSLGIMISFLEVCENTREKLGRELHEVEVELLKWTHKRYELEQQKCKQTNKSVNEV